MNRKMTLIGFIILAMVTCLLSTGFCDERRAVIKGLWMEIWHDSTYRTSNFAAKNPSPAQEDFYLSQTSVDTGIRFAAGNNIFIDPYLTMDLALDLGSRAWNKAYWNNNYKWGPGVRMRYERNDEDNKKGSYLWLKSMNVGPFIEYLYQENSLDSSKDNIPGNVPDDNWRCGISTWMSFDSKKSGRFGPWAEIWTELAYNKNNFYRNAYDDFYLLFFQPKIGVEWEFDHLAVQPYLKCDLSYDFGNSAWNKEPWLNNVTYGPGFRLSVSDIKPLKGAVFHIFTEYLMIDYFSRVNDASYANRASNDFRVGINIWLPFGVTRESTIRK